MQDFDEACRNIRNKKLVDILRIKLCDLLSKINSNNYLLKGK